MTTAPGNTETVAAGTLLVVDDDPTVAEVATRYLRREGYVVRHAADGPSALASVGALLPDLVVLDLMLPGVHGLEVLARLRETRRVPVIVLTALGDEGDRVTGLELGADDYLPKPFSPRELAARVRAVLRRARARTPDGQEIAVGPVHLDVCRGRATVRGAEVVLTAKEAALLHFFLLHPREAFRREVLLEQVWGWTIGDTSTVTVHVRHLREKVEQDPSRPELIRTVWGVGYRFDPGGP